MNTKQIRTLIVGLVLAVEVLALQPMRNVHERTNRFGNPAPSRYTPDDERNLLLLVVIVLGTGAFVYAYRETPSEE